MATKTRVQTHELYSITVGNQAGLPFEDGIFEEIPKLSSDKSRNIFGQQSYIRYFKGLCFLDSNFTLEGAYSYKLFVSLTVLC